MIITHVVLKKIPFGGGIEKYVEEIGVRLASKGHEIRICTIKHYGERKGMYKGMSIIPVPSLKTRHLEKPVAALLAMVCQSIRKEVDIVHVHAVPAVFVSIIPRLFGKKVIAHGHGLEWKRSRWGLITRQLLKMMESVSVNFSNILCVVSKTQQRYFESRYRKNCFYVPQGVALSEVEQPDLIKKYGLFGNDYILFVARLVREKGAHHLIKAYRDVDTNVKLVVAGDAPYEEQYKSELYNLAKGNDRIIFTGFIDGKLKRELFSNPYLFVVPSEVEGLSISLLEAMSYGNCCLVSDIPENLEAIDQFGYSFRCHDVKDLKQKLEILLGDKNMAMKVKERARDYTLKNYSWDKVADELEKIYCDLMK